MEIAQKMAGNSEVKKRCPKGRVQRAFAKLALACVLLLCVIPATAYAAPPPPPVIGDTDWRTGEIEVAWSNVTPGFTLILYTRTYKETSFTARDTWIADTASGTHITKFYENGQTLWHYLVAVNPVTGEMSAPSNEGKQTPPITAYIINWPDMLKDLQKALDGIKDTINDANQSLKDHLDSLFTPGQDAMNNLKNAVDQLKDATGSGAAGNAGNDLKNGFDDVKNGLKPPVTKNDGVGTFTGGAKSNEIPGLDGTHNEMTWCVPITYKMDGSPFNACIFTDEQLEKMKWWQVVRELIGYTEFITFGIWVVTRFTPQFKV